MLIVRLITMLPLIVLAAAMLADPARLVRSIERASVAFSSIWLMSYPRRRRAEAMSNAGVYYVRSCGIVLAMVCALLISR